MELKSTDEEAHRHRLNRSNRTFMELKWYLA